MAVIGKDIFEAKKQLEKGEVIGIPTETVYGLAGNAFDVEAVTKIFQVKNRPTFDPLIVHVATLDDFHKVVRTIPLKAFILAEKFMPGPLTLLLPKHDNIPDLVTAGLDEVAIRIPKHDLSLELLRNLDFPLAAPSANPFGYISPTSAQHVDNQLGTKINYILDGGECSVGIESTIVGFRKNKHEEEEIIVYRKGGLSIEAIEKIVGKVIIQANSTSNPKAPGMLKSHYAPKVGLQLMSVNFKESNPASVAFLGFKKLNDDIPIENQLLLSPSGNYAEAAKNLFAFMRTLDNMPHVHKIYAELLPEEDLGRAINDRIRRASAK